MFYLKMIFIYHCLSYLGRPYIWGGNTPIGGMDCSGFAQVVLDAFGVDPPGDQSSQQLYYHFISTGKGTVLHRSSWTGPPVGALLFFGKTEYKIIHVAVSIGGGLMVEAGGGGSRTLTVHDAVSQGAFVRVRQVTRRRDLFAVVVPRGLPWTGKIHSDDVGGAL